MIAMAMSQRDLAEKLELSQMTVCRALRGDECVKPDVRKRVLTAAQRHGYPLAARFRRNSAALQHVVCSIVEIHPERGGGDFNARLLAGIRHGIREANAQLMNFDTPPSQWMRAPDRSTEWPLVVMRRQVDGVVHLFGGDLDHLPRYSCPVPHVSIFHPIDEHSDVATVDNIGGGRALGDHLGRLGHRRVAFIGPTTPLADDRLLGLRAGLQAHGGAIPNELVATEKHASNPEDTARLLGALLPPDVRDPAAVRARFTAVAVYNDYMAVGAIAELNRRGLRVPEDISVTGFDACVPPGYQGPALTTAAIPLEELGAEAARLLYWRMDCPTALCRTLMLETKLVKGESVGSQGSGVRGQ